MIEFSLARRVLANLLTLFLSGEGAFAFLTIWWEMIPEFTYFTVMIEERGTPTPCSRRVLSGRSSLSRPSSMNNTSIPHPFSRGASLAVRRSWILGMGQDAGAAVSTA